jgi:hypothetical protein
MGIICNKPADTSKRSNHSATPRNQEEIERKTRDRIEKNQAKEEEEKREYERNRFISQVEHKNNRIRFLAYVELKNKRMQKSMDDYTCICCGEDIDDDTCTGSVVRSSSGVYVACDTCKRRCDTNTLGEIERTCWLDSHDRKEHLDILKYDKRQAKKREEKERVGETIRQEQLRYQQDYQLRCRGIAVQERIANSSHRNHNGNGNGDARFVNNIATGALIGGVIGGADGAMIGGTAGAFM